METSTSAEPGTTTSGASDGTTASMPVDCNVIEDIDECSLHPECQTVGGAEATPTETPGEYYCSDIKAPFGCAPVECDEISVVTVVCRIDDPNEAMWIYEGCIPGGWEQCPGASCM